MDPNDSTRPTGDPVTAQVVGPASQTPPARRRPWRTFLLVLLLLAAPLVLLALAGSMLLNMLLLGGSFDTQSRVREKFHSHSRSAESKIAIISIEGVILGGDGFIKKQIDQAQRDEDVKAVVLRVNSPGGTITGSDYIYHHLNELASERGIPLVVSMGGLAASGGYYVAMAVGDTPKSIFAEHTTWTGSIGVIIPLYEVAELMEKLGVTENSIASHRLKKMGSFTNPLTEEERAIFQELVDDSFDRFKNVIKQGRPKFQKKPEALEELATGRIFTAEQALENGLVDRIGFIEDAVDRAIELSGLEPSEVRVVEYAPEPTVADLFVGARAHRAEIDWATILEMGTPRAYYLWTRLPPLIRSGA